MTELYKVKTIFLFHTNIKLKIPDCYGDDILDKGVEILEEVNKNYNSYSEKSYISKINQNAGKYVYADEETVNMLDTIREYSDVLDGEYDITIMPLIKTWGSYKENQEKIPSKDEIEKALQLVDYRKIQIDKKYNRVKIEEGQEIITGSFIKSYAVDKVIDYFKEQNIYKAIINAGGSTIYSLNIGENEDDSLEIGVENPNDENDEIFEIKINNEAYSTSGQQNTYVQINGEQYGHIFSPKTGYPSKNKQIGIITESAFIGDVVSTGLYNQAPDNFYKIIDKLKSKIKIEGFLMDEHNKIHSTKGFDDYITEKKGEN